MKIPRKTSNALCGLLSGLLLLAAGTAQTHAALLAPAVPGSELYAANDGVTAIVKITPGGVGSVFASGGSLTSPRGVVFDSVGNLYVGNIGGNTIVKITPGGVRSVFASTLLSGPEDLAFDSAGNLYAANFFNSTVVKFTPSGVGSVFADSSDGLNGAVGLAFDSAGTLFVGSYYNNRIVKFTPGGVGSVFASSGLNGPFGLAFDSAGNLYAASWNNNTIRKFTPGGVGSVFANTGLNGPSGLAFDSAGNLFVSNYGASNVRKFSSTGTDLGVFADSIDGLPAPAFIAFGPALNSPPIANAGSSRAVMDADNNDVSTVVTLDGSGSRDPEGAALTYSWTQIPAPTVALTGANTPMPTFTAPDLHNHPSGQPQPIPLTFRLVVSDGSLTSAANVTITVVHNNLPPVANASASISPQDEGTITLNGQLSTDADQDPLTYTWTRTGGTPVSITPNGTNASSSSFTHMINAPHSNPGETLTFTLTVTDGIASSSTPVSVFVQNVNHAPTASAAPVDPVFDNVGIVTLSGEGLDTDGDTVNLHWVQVAGPSVTLNADTTANPSFTAPPVTTAQGSVTLTFQLIANDSNGSGDAAALSSLPASVDVLVKHANRAPIADAGQTRDVPEQSSVTLDGSGSYDLDQDPLTYAWQQVGTQTVTLDVTDPVHPTFIAPDVGTAGQTLTFRLIVTDTAPIGSGGNLTSSPSTVVINVKYVNQPPAAVAAATPPANEGSVVTLDGSQSSDPDGNAFTYQWTPSAGLDLTDPAHPTFTAPQVDRFGGTATFTLQVTDEFGAVSNVATTSVVINNVNHAPTADAGLLQSVPENTAIGLGGLGLDLDSEEEPLLTYAWVQVGSPTVTLLGANTPTPTFTTPTVTAGGDPNASVTLKFKLTVTDPNNASGSAETTVVVKNEDHAPLANAGGASFANEATLVILNGNGSSDPDDDALSYSWQQIPAPLVPMVTLSNANTATPSFTAPFVNAAGLTLKFKLTVNDGYGGTSTDTAIVTVVNTNDAPTLSNPQASLGSLWAPDHRLVKVSILGVVDPNNNAMITITRVTQDEATNGLGDGDTAIDAIINADGTVMLRAERSGKGNGRVYHVHFTASDPESQALGTSVSGIVKVSVPHSKKTDAAIDGGELYDSTR